MAEETFFTEFDESGDTSVVEKKKLKTPKMFCVVFHNDDFTTQEFVIHVLMNFFYKNQVDAHSLMMKIHSEGKAKVGEFTKDVAESKVAIATSFSRQNDMPLLMVAEPA